MSEIEITQADRDLAAAVTEEFFTARHIRSGNKDSHATVKAIARHRHEARSDGERYKRALMDIGAAIQAGRVCDDVAWFDSVETLFDFVSSALEPDHTEPAPDMFGKFPISRDERRIIEWLRASYFNPDDDIIAMIERGEHRN